MFKNLRMIALAAAFAFAAPAVAGCDTIARIGADIKQQSATITPSQVQTVADATLAATAATSAMEVVVRTGVIKDNAVLLQIKALNDGVQAALHRWHNAADKGNSIYAASFNAALDAFNAYKSVKTGS